MPVFDDISWPTSGRWIRANILMDAQGNVTGADGTSATLTRGRDRELLRQLRADADAVIVGGASVRAEGWFFPPHGDIVVVSKSGMLPVTEAAHPDRIHVVPSIEDLIAALDERDSRRVVCESGPKLLRILINAGLIDELFVSTVHEDPTTADESADPLDTDTDFELAERVDDPDATYSRYVRRRVIPRATDSAR